MTNQVAGASARERSQARPKLAWPAGFLLAGAALFLVYLTQSTRDAFVNSDGASNALQAWAMLHGNVLLHGWTVSDVSFYTTELPEYALVEAIRGLGPGVVHICGALSYTLLVLLAAALAKGDATGRAGLARALTAGGIMLAPQLGDPTGMLMLSPDHVGTGVPVLLAFLVADRGERASRGGQAGRWLVPAAVGFLLAWTIVADQLAAVIGSLALAVACVSRIAQEVAAGDRARAALSRCRHEIALLMAAVLAVPVALLATKLIAAAGGWSITPFRARLADPGVLSRNAYLTGTGILELFGADFLGQPSTLLTVFAVVHLAGLALAGAGLAAAVRRFPAAPLAVRALAAGIVVNVAAYVFTVQAQNIKTTREIAALLPFAAVLAGRLLPPLVTGGAARRAVTLIAAGAGAALLACYAVMLGWNASRPPAPDPPAVIAAWLASHHLNRGLGGYWQASSVTVDSHDTVRVRAIDINNGVLTAGSYWEADKAWYDASTQYADFIVDWPVPWHAHPLIDKMEILAGKPARICQFTVPATAAAPATVITVAVWHRNLLAYLASPA